MPIGLHYIVIKGLIKICSSLKHAAGLDNQSCLIERFTLKVVFSMTCLSNTMEVADVACELLDCINLLMEKVALDEVRGLVVVVLVRNGVKIKESLVDFTFQLQGGLHGIETISPFVLRWLLNGFKYNLSTTIVLVLHEFLGMFVFLVSTFLEVLGKVV